MDTTKARAFTPGRVLALGLIAVLVLGLAYLRFAPDWDSLENEVFVSVRDDRSGDDFVLNPPKHEALSAFHHPYAVRPIEPPSLVAAQPARGRLEV